MRNVLFDFSFTVISPLLVVASLVLARSLYAWLRENERGARRLAALSGVAVGLLVGSLFLDSTRKLILASLAWQALNFFTLISVFVLIGMAYHYATTKDDVYHFGEPWKSALFKFALCLLGLLIVCGAEEHFTHQEFNTHHILCPHCSDDDDDRPDDDY